MIDFNIDLLFKPSLAFFLVGRDLPLAENLKLGVYGGYADAALDVVSGESPNNVSTIYHGSNFMGEMAFKYEAKSVTLFFSYRSAGISELKNSGGDPFTISGSEPMPVDFSGLSAGFAINFGGSTGQVPAVR